MAGPYLFVICMDMLGRTIKEATEDPRFHYHPKCKCLSLTHMAYADDLLIFGKADMHSVGVIKGCLDRFAAASSLKANNDKSCVYVARMT